MEKGMFKELYQFIEKNGRGTYPETEFPGFCFDKGIKMRDKRFLLDFGDYLLPKNVWKATIIWGDALKWFNNGKTEKEVDRICYHAHHNVGNVLELNHGLKRAFTKKHFNDLGKGYIEDIKHKDSGIEDIAGNAVVAFRLAREKKDDEIKRLVEKRNKEIGSCPLPESLYQEIIKMKIDGFNRSTKLRGYNYNLKY